MLVLTRKLMEKLYIGGDICVTVVRLEGGQVRLGIDAPRDVTVVRAELLPKLDSNALPPPSSVHHEIRPDLKRAYTPKLSASPDAGSPAPRPPVRIPPSWARGTGSPPRGPSR